MGRAAALLFAAHGARVVVTDIDRAGLEETAAQVRRSGGQVVAHTADVQDESAVSELVARAGAEFGGVHNVLNFAAVHRPRRDTFDCTSEEWDRTVGVTLKGTWLVSSHAMRAMRGNPPAGDRGLRGSVVTVASAMAHRGAPKFVAYTAAKAGVLGLTRAMANDGAPFGIRVNCISPGLTRTPATPLEPGSEAERGAVARLHLLPYLCEPEDQAQAALWLCSDAAACLTGSTIDVDGGWTARE
jgi:NAD(P)-dependent dehydrogenase (short-subunit alcohol dehydrogenase family)